MYYIDQNQINTFINQICARKRIRKVVKNFFSNCSSMSLTSWQNIRDAIYTVYESGICFNFHQPYLYLNKQKFLYNNTLNRLANMYWDYFNKKGNTQNKQAKFDVFHGKLCKKFLKLNSLHPTTIKFTYGNAQKLINMTFKYLTCFGDYRQKADLFSYCHMPIDTVILKYLYLKVGMESCENNKYNGVSWTKFNSTHYQKLLNEYRKSVGKNMNESYLSYEYRAWSGQSSNFATTPCPNVNNFYM